MTWKKDRCFLSLFLCFAFIRGWVFIRFDLCRLSEERPRSSSSLSLRAISGLNRTCCELSH